MNSDIENKCKQKGVRLTDQRKLIAKVMSQSDNHPDVGERFCVQCHNPISFLTGVGLEGNEDLESFQNSNLPEEVKHGISCSVCHTYTALSPSYFADDNFKSFSVVYTSIDCLCNVSTISSNLAFTTFKIKFLLIFLKLELIK